MVVSKSYWYISWLKRRPELLTKNSKLVHVLARRRMRVSALQSFSVLQSAYDPECSFSSSCLNVLDC